MLYNTFKRSTGRTLSMPTTSGKSLSQKNERGHWVKMKEIEGRGNGNYERENKRI